ncbi:N-acetylmuramic acid 6-phosphate etherase [Alphaproteobacteria bacterium]|nr:N-acetylmuramic acid 6-phosphate etherase [Alphaproteobacteria bacterium]
MDQNIPKTECVFKKSKHIDKLNVFDGITLMVDEQKKAALEVKKVSKSIELAVNKIYEHLTLHPKGRLIYVGAGTSGRIGVQDGVELFPTFHWPKKRLDFIIAGGSQALLSAVENAEDNMISAERIVIQKAICKNDVVIGLAASGNTPFTCQVLEKSKSNKALTLAISNNPKGKILNHCDLKIILNTKEEVIAGSTRLKAGTAQKICLNIISSMVMVKMGRVKNGVMNEMVPTNEKLRLRKQLIETKLL